MKNWIVGPRIVLVVVTVLLALAATLAGAARMKPDLAAKREMVRKQQEQRVTPEKQQAAVVDLKAERLKIYKAKQAALKANMGTGK